MLIDSHCHLRHKKYQKTPEQLVTEAVAAGVEKLIDIGTSVVENEAAIKNAQTFKNVYASVAIYPHDDIGEENIKLMAELRRQLDKSRKIVAIGETGIDISEWDGGRSLVDQKILFEEHIKLAVESNLPIIIHNRNGDDKVLEILKKYQGKNLRGVAHCFASSWEFAEKLLNLDFYLSFSCMITYPSNKHLLETVKNVPLDRFLFETDAPYLPPQNMRGQTNEPGNVIYAARKFSDVRGLEFEKICELSYSNTCDLFKLE